MDEMRILISGPGENVCKLLMRIAEGDLAEEPLRVEVAAGRLCPQSLDEFSTAALCRELEKRPSVKSIWVGLSEARSIDVEGLANILIVTD